MQRKYVVMIIILLIVKQITEEQNNLNQKVFLCTIYIGPYESTILDYEENETSNWNSLL